MANYRIKEAVAKVVLQNNHSFWLRISRAKYTSLVHYWQNYPNFKYIKFYEFDRKTRHTGLQLGYITLKGFSFN